MTKITIAIGSDHRGYELKEFLKKNFFLESYTINWLDCGAHNSERSDYPIFAQYATKAILEKRSQLGVLLCGTGIGMTITANRFAGIYAGVLWDTKIAERARQEDNINIAVLPADFVTQEEAISIITTWLTHEFRGNTYAKRLAMIDSTIK